MQQAQRFIEIAIKQCRNGGIDCKVHGIQLVGRHSAHALPMDDTAAFGRLLPPDFEFEQVWFFFLLNSQLPLLKPFSY